MSLETFVARLPKVELHLHLEGAIPLDALFTLVQRHGGHPDAPDPATLAARFQFCSFDEFIDAWIWKNQFLRAAEDFQFVAREISLWLRRSHVVYAEAFFSPGDFQRHGLTVPEITEALDDGLRQGEAAGGARVRMIADLIRDYGPGPGLRFLEELHRCECPRLIGIGIGGTEVGNPPEAYAEIYRRARDLGYHLTAHAGETAGPESVRGALDALKVERIGHGLRAGEDPALLERLVAEAVPLEMCPVSNVCTASVPGLEHHPLARYLRAGACVTINTDDPGMFGTDMNREMVDTARALDLSREELVRLSRNAIDASWASPEEKTALHRGLDAALAAD